MGEAEKREIRVVYATEGDGSEYVVHTADGKPVSNVVIIFPMLDPERLLPIVQQLDPDMARKIRDAIGRDE